MGAIYTEGDRRWELDVIGKGAKPQVTMMPRLITSFSMSRKLSKMGSRAMPCG